MPFSISRTAAQKKELLLADS